MSTPVGKSQMPMLHCKRPEMARVLVSVGVMAMLESEHFHLPMDSN